MKISRNRTRMCSGSREKSLTKGRFLTTGLTLVILSLAFLIAQRSVFGSNYALLAAANTCSGYMANDTAYSVEKVPVYVDSVKLIQDSIISVRLSLIEEVRTYMKRVAPRTELSPENIVLTCEARDFDIPLLLSQCQIESIFGTRQVGNSCFGVISRRYPTKDESVRDYVELMRKHYLISRTPEQLIASNFRMERSSAKYAGNPSYGQTIGMVRNKIIKTTNIRSYFNTLQELKSQLESVQD